MIFAVFPERSSCLAFFKTFFSRWHARVFHGHGILHRGAYHRPDGHSVVQERKISLPPSHKEQCEKRKLFLTSVIFSIFFGQRKSPEISPRGKRKTALVFKPTPHPNLYYFFCFSFCIASTFPQNSSYFSRIAFSLFVTAL